MSFMVIASNILFEIDWNTVHSKQINILFIVQQFYNLY